MRVAVLPERYGQVFSPCASIRLQPFFDELRSCDGIEVRYVLLSELNAYRPDLIVWHRVSLATTEEVSALASLVKKLGARTIYDLDDNLLNLEGHNEQDDYSSKKGAVLKSLALADEVWCSTSRLAERVADVCDTEILVRPNALDPVLWNLPAGPALLSHSGPLRLLYMGTRTHDADFALLNAAVRLFQSRNPGGIELSLIGVNASPTSADPWIRMISPPSHVGASYPAFVRWFRELRGFDLGVAPLLSTPFNDCKSPIKILDYAAIGLPALASRMPAYLSLASGTECIHAENTVEAWADAFARISSDRTCLRVLAEAAQSLVDPDVFSQAVSSRLDRIRQARFSQ